MRKRKVKDKTWLCIRPCRKLAEREFYLPWPKLAEIWCLFIRIFTKTVIPLASNITWMQKCNFFFSLLNWHFLCFLIFDFDLIWFSFIFLYHLHNVSRYQRFCFTRKSYCALCWLLILHYLFARLRTEFLIF